MNDNTKTRLLYPDVCKFIAMFAVTLGHCSQAISGEQYSNLFGGGNYDIAFHMPLFMLLSGWFLNFNKIRNSEVWTFLKDKAIRLMLPSISWCIIYNALGLHIPTIHTLLFFYWFLITLFLCHVLILIVAKLVKNNTLVCIIVIGISLLIFHKNLCRINFMMPFIIMGYSIRRIIENEKYASILFFLSLIASVLLSINWSVEYTVYEQPFIITRISKMMCLSFFYRIAIGTAFSLVIICLSIKMNSNNMIAKYFAKLGNMTLVMYTFSFVMNAIFSKILAFYNFQTNEYILIDLLSICLCIVICVFTYFLVSLCRKNCITRLILCGERVAG